MSTAERKPAQSALAQLEASALAVLKQHKDGLRTGEVARILDLALNRIALQQIQTGLLVAFWKISYPRGGHCQKGTVRPVCSAPSNIAVKWDWLTAGFARFQPAPYLER